MTYDRSKRMKELWKNPIYLEKMRVRSEKAKKRVKQITLVSYICKGCEQIFKTQLRRIKSGGNWCLPCKNRENNRLRKEKGLYIVTSEQRKKMSLAKKGKPSWSKGKKLTTEHRKKLSLAHLGQKSWNKGKCLVSPEYRILREKIHDCCSSMVRRILKIKNEKKVRKTFDYLGYTKSQFVTHIENQFKENMSWNNYGEWQVDHIIPVANFVKRGIYESKEINALHNLQPLWKEENLKKSCYI